MAVPARLKEFQRQRLAPDAFYGALRVPTKSMEVCFRAFDACADQKSQPCPVPLLNVQIGHSLATSDLRTAFTKVLVLSISAVRIEFKPTANRAFEGRQFTPQPPISEDSTMRIDDIGFV
jgi:hypothetical protein